ncbi:MAG: hypothetical protein RJB38_583 [Pseudomonadota bacterium]|jgi:hypothetical protein
MTANEKGGTDRQNDQDKNAEQATHETVGAKATDSATQAEATAKKVTPSIQQDLFDNIHRLRVGSNFTEKSNPQKVLVTVPVRKPEPQEFFRVHPAEEYQFDTYTVEVKSKKEHYLIEPNLIPYLPSDAKPKLIFTCINAQGVVFLYPLPLGQAARANDYTRSAFTAVELAKKSWVRMTANETLKAYDIWEGSIEIPDPDWPTQPMTELLRIAFRERFIDSIEHPIIKQLAAVKRT